MSENKNRRPEEASNFPLVSLLVLLLIIGGLLYIGYEYIADDAVDIEEITNTPIDTNSQEMQPLPSNDEPLTPSYDDTQANDVAATPTPQKEEKTPIPPPAATVTTQQEEPTKKEETPQPAAADIGGVEIIHTVQPGETFFGIANRYNLSRSTLKGLNTSIQDESKDIKSGVTRLKVRVKAVHTVGPGDILRVVAEKYGVTVEQLMAANKKTKNYAERGEKLIIPFPQKK
ncbi:MAG: LysM peptidoglycan-binding domain-containing protein [Runella sp.]